jgi:hypothetical protein
MGHLIKNDARGEINRTYLVSYWVVKAIDMRRFVALTPFTVGKPGAFSFQIEKKLKAKGL